MIAIHAAEDTSLQLGTVILTVSGVAPTVSSIRYAVRRRASGESLVVTSDRDGRWQRALDAWLVPEDAWYSGSDLKLQIGPAVSTWIDPGIPYDFVFTGKGLAETTVSYTWPRQLPLESSGEKPGPVTGVDTEDNERRIKGGGIAPFKPEPKKAEPPKKENDGPDRAGSNGADRIGPNQTDKIEQPTRWAWPWRSRRLSSDGPRGQLHNQPPEWLPVRWLAWPVFIVALFNPQAHTAAAAPRPAASLPWLNIFFVALLIALLVFLARTSPGRDVVMKIAGYFSPVTEVVDERNPETRRLAASTPIPPLHPVNPPIPTPPPPHDGTGHSQAGTPNDRAGHIQTRPAPNDHTGAGPGQNTGPAPVPVPNPVPVPVPDQQGTGQDGHSRPVPDSHTRSNTGQDGQSHDHVTPLPPPVVPTPPAPRPELSPLQSALHDLDLGNCPAGIAELKNLGRNPVALYTLAKIYRAGDMSSYVGPASCAVPNASLAASYLRQAAEAGYGFAEFALGKMAKDRGAMDDARRWITDAARQHVPGADDELLHLQ
jgi:hypothetical protein